jgi:hypothetical protein
MKLSRIAALAAVSVATLCVPASANHSWGGYHWAGNGSNITLRVNKAITSQWTTSVNKAISDWDSSNELTLISQNAPAGTNAKKCSPIAGQVLVCNAAYGNRGWLGIASIWLSRGHISQATTKLNDSYHNNPPYNSPDWRALVACQEVGHDFGLDHQDENFDNANLGTCMDYTSNPAGPPANTAPNSHDYQQLNTIYNHDDGFTTAAAGTNFGIRQVGKAVPQTPSSEAVGDSPSEWGRAIHRDSRGRPDVFVKELGPREKVITHVFWALETKRPQTE